MKTISINLYTFDELDKKAQYNAWCNSPGFSDDHDDAFLETLAEFERIFDVDVWKYNVDPLFLPSWKFFTVGDAYDGGNPVRLARFVWNNYAEYILKGKYYSTRVKTENGVCSYKYRHSNIIKSFDSCPLTGMYCDDIILRPIIECLHYNRFFETYDELINECLSAFFHEWIAEKEYCGSLEYFADECATLEWYFTADGKLYEGA